MILIGLLLIAAVCLAVGLDLASAAWLVGSLAATAAAAYLLWRNRHKIGAPATPAAEPDAEEHDDSGPFAPIPPVHDVSVAADHVWVVDGRPEFHLAGCARLGPAAEPIPRMQAIEDGFVACTACRPATPVPAAPPVADAPTGVVRVADAPTEVLPVVAADDVWVVDGRPNYRLAGCTLLAGATAEAIPRSQALEDGFIGCGVCDPDGVRASAPEPEPLVVPEPEPLVASEPVALVAPEPVVEATAEHGAAPGQVWVVDGRPRYHRSECMIIKGQHAEPIPHEQATEDGFTPCSLCEPDVVRSP